MTLLEGKKHVSLVVCGHIDAGKSTTIGRLFFELGCIPEREMQKLRTEAERIGKGSFTFAFYTDNQKEERERGKTINSKMKEFFTESYHYTIIDVPGHRDFIKNMITGSSQADIALILVPADGSFENSIAKGNTKTFHREGQTRQHALLVNLIGIKQIIIGVNKMDCDIAAYREARFNQIRDEMHILLQRVGFKKEFIEKSVPFLPISAWKGDNLITPSIQMSWWKGMDIEVQGIGKKNIVTLLHALERMVILPQRDLHKPMRTPIFAVHRIKGIGDVLTGRVEQGNCKPGDEVVFLPNHAPPSKWCMGKIFTMEMHHKSLSEVNAGDNVGFNIKGLSRDNMPQSGSIMIHKSDNSLSKCKEFICQVLVINLPNELKVGYTPIAFVRTGRSPVRMSTINWKLNKATENSTKVPSPLFIKANEMAEVVFEVLQPFVLESFKNCEGLGRVAIMESGVVVMLGKVIKTISETDKIEWTILEMLCITKTHLPKDIRGVIAQTMVTIWRKEEMQKLKRCK